MNVTMLCKMIDMPDEVIQKIDGWGAEKYREELDQYWIQIQDASHWNAAQEKIEILFADDRYGLNCLAFMLQISLRSYQEYILKGIPEQIYLATMGCFSRFVKEHMESYGTYGFDREWWTVRELSLKEFRLGELEYEMNEEGNRRIISVHIPSDVRLEEQKRIESYKKAESFFAEYYSGFAASEYCCESWLLSPKLKELLPDNSHIVSFQNDFILESYDPENTDFMLWVFKNRQLSLEELPQNTSLQRNIKAYLKNGGKIGAGFGHRKEELLK